MVKQRNGKTKLIGKSIILNEKDRRKRINILRASIIAGNDNKKMHQELSELTNQEINKDKKPEDLLQDLQSLTPILKTSIADENVKNRVYNIIDYLRSNQLISRSQYHKYIKKIYYNIIYKMDKPIFIDTTKKSIDTLWGYNNNLTINMSGDGLELDTASENYIALQSLTMSYTWNNIDVNKFNNNTLRISSNTGSSWTSITFPYGNYTYSDISQYISNYLESQNVDKDGIQIDYVSSLKRCFIELKENFQVDFRSNLSFGELLGFNNLLTTSSYGTLVPNITNSVDNIIIRCSLINSSNFNGYQADSALYMFDTSSYRIGYSFTTNETNLIYHKINTNNIKKFTIKIQDGLGRFIYLKDTQVSMVLFIRSF